MVDPLGYLTENKFDAAGRLVESIRYYTRTAAGNTAPVWLGVTNQTGAAGNAFSYKLPAAYDPDGDGLSFSVLSKPSWLNFDAGTLTLSGTPTATGTFTVSLRATDDRDKTTDVSFTLTISNTPPTWTALANQSVAVNDSFNYTVPAAADANGNTLTYSVVGTLPAGVAFNAGTRVLSGTPTVVGAHTITLRASDGYDGVIDRSLTLTVTNTAPSWSTLPNYSIPVNTSINHVLPAASDAEDSTLTYAMVSALPSGVTFTASSRTFGGKATTAGTYNLSVKVTDPHGAVTTRSFTLTVTNTGPSWPTIAAQSGRVNTNFSYVVPAATDPEAQTLTYSAVSLPAGLSFDAATRTLSGKPSNDGAQTVTLRATDPQGAYANVSFTLNVANDTPTWTTIATQNATVNTAFSYTVPAATDPEGQTLSYSVIGSLPSGLSFNATTRVLSGTPTVGGSHSIKVRATDPHGAYVERSFTLAVANSVPVYAGGINDMSAVVGTSFSFTVPSSSFTDANNETLTYSANGVNRFYDGELREWFEWPRALPAGLSFNASTRTLSGTPTTAGTYLIEFNARDGSNAEATRRITLTVGNPNRAPVYNGGTWTAAATRYQSFSYQIPAGHFTDPDGNPLT